MTLRSALVLASAAALLGLVLLVPNRPSAMALQAFTRVPLELPVLLGLMLVLSPYPGLARACRAVIVVALLVVLLLKAADFTIYESFSRPFNLVIDMFVVPAGMNLLTGALGQMGAVAVAVGAILALISIAWSIWWALGRWARLTPGRVGRRTAGAVAIVSAGLVVADTGHMLGNWTLPENPPGSALTTRLAVAHVARASRTAQDLADFRQAADRDSWADADGVFDLLDGRDVLIVFLESYGRASFDNPLYADSHVPQLRDAQAALDAQGLAMRSLWLTSPIQGGQSWLAHGTFASGLEIGDQGRYRAMLASPRQTLFHLAAKAGYRTGAVMPAITMSWPQGPLVGFETILAAADLGYAGAPFNWVTMPDQYTLAAYPARLADDPRPDFLQIALISSHAPWTPVPWMLDWDAVGDGTEFNAMAAAGETPRQVWKDRDRVRAHYRDAVAYTLEATFSFVERQAGPDAPLIIVLGDHQAAPSIAQTDTMDVPIHLIGPPDLLARIDTWGATEGLLPAADAPVWPMEAFRDRFIAAFTSGSGES
ncbi:MAG: sulfatase-like hydrolase/transferase [Pseudomonadota bacterium]